MGIARRYSAAVGLQNGTVLMAGGLNGANSAQTYSPDSLTFTWAANNMRNTATDPPGALIVNTEAASDGMVFIVGGDTSLSELYNPSARSFSPAGQMSVRRSQFGATMFMGPTEFSESCKTSSRRNKTSAASKCFRNSLLSKYLL